MASHGQLDNVYVVSYAGGAKTSAPLTGAGGLTPMNVAFFSSIEAMDLALTSDVGIKAADIPVMNGNDKVYALRKFLEGGGVLKALAQPLPTQIETTTSPTTEKHPWGTVWLNTTTQQVYQTPGDGTWVLLEDFV